MDRAGTVIVGVGNPLRGDDGAGPAVIRALHRLGLGRSVTLTESGGDAAELLELWDGARQAVVVDAIRSGAPPGSVHVLGHPGREELPSLRGVSVHGLGLATAIGLARELGRLPSRLTVIGIEAGRCELGAPMSPPVRAGVIQAAQLLSGAFRGAPAQSRARDAAMLAFGSRAAVGVPTP